MRLLRLALRDFRRFPALDVAFGPGFNVIVGNNEEGKSTLRDAITLALFQDPKTRERKVLRQQRWGAAGSFGLRLEIEAGGQHLVLEKDFEERSSVLDATGSGQRIHDAKAIEARMKDMLGLASREVFESTARIAQRDVAQLKAGLEIADALQTVVTGGEGDTMASDVIEQIDSALGRLKTTARVNPGPLSALPPKIASLESRAAYVTTAVGRAAQAQLDLLAKRQELDATQELVGLKQRQQAICAKRLDLEAARVKAADDERQSDGRVERARALSDGITRAEAELDRRRHLLDVGPEQLAEVAGLERAGTAQQADPAGQPVATSGGRPRPIVLLAGAVLVVAGFLTHLAVSAVGLGVIAFEIYHARSSGKTALLAWQMRARERQEAVDESRQRLREMLATLGCASPAELRAEHSAAQALRSQSATLSARLEEALAGQSVESLEQLRKDATRRLRSIDEALAEPEMQTAQVDQESYQRLLRDVEALQRRAKLLGEEVAQCRATIAANQADVAQLHSMEEELQELREALAAAERRREILSLTKQVLAEAREASVVSAIEVLRDELGGLIAAITAGRYTQVVVDDRLGIKVIAPESGAAVDVALDGELSTGTVEQIYLAARIAIVRLLAGDCRPPLILDDPFLSFDAARTKAVLDLCRRLSADYQILLFTCRQDYAAPEDHVIRLPATSGRR